MAKHDIKAIVLKRHVFATAFYPLDIIGVIRIRSDGLQHLVMALFESRVLGRTRHRIVPEQCVNPAGFGLALDRDGVELERREIRNEFRRFLPDDDVDAIGLRLPFQP